ncbi:MAG: hypothetical protein PHT07_01140 [Paludibacter sp.]|nr:hypothetical protein [Paludibacter sp.]
MRKICLLLLIVLAPVLIFSQVIIGNYQFSFDLYWKGHTNIYLDLKKDYTYTFKMMDDCSGEITTGSWKIIGNELLLTPSVIPDKVIIDPTKTGNKKNNIIEIYRNSDLKKGIRVEVYAFGKPKTYTSDFKGQICLKENYDSLNVMVGNKKYTVHESNDFTNTLLRLYIRTDNKDLVYRMLGTDRIKIINNRLSITYRSERKKKYVTEFFEKIK